MREALFLLCVCGTAAAEEPAMFLETEIERTSYYVHEPIRLTLRIRMDTGFLKTNIVQMFQREFDVPVQVDAPWLDELEEAVVSATASPDGSSFVLNGREARARIADEGSYRVLLIERTLVPTSPGELTLAAPRVRFAYGTKFEEDFVNGRVALDQRDASVGGKSMTLTIQALPAAGRPENFSGAVGRFSVHAQAAPRELDAGAILKLTLRIEGEGSLAYFNKPRLDGLAGFHVYGAIDDKGAPLRTITYDIAPLTGDVTEVPAIPFAFFEPRADAYRVVHTEPIALSVRGPTTPTAKAPAQGMSPWLWATPIAVAVAFLLLARRRRRPDVADARTTFRERAATDVTAAFTEYLASRLQCSTASVIAPDLAGRLTGAGVPGELAGRTAALLERMVGARYGGSEVGVAEAHDLVDALEDAFPLA